MKSSIFVIFSSFVSLTFIGHAAPYAEPNYKSETQRVQGPPAKVEPQAPALPIEIIETIDIHKPQQARNQTSKTPQKQPRPAPPFALGLVGNFFDHDKNGAVIGYQFKSESAHLWLIDILLTTKPAARPAVHRYFTLPLSSVAFFTARAGAAVDLQGRQKLGAFLNFENYQAVLAAGVEDHLSDTSFRIEMELASGINSTSLSVLVSFLFDL